MTTEKRRGKLELDLKAAELEFAAELVAALKKCAAGRWGLFGQNGERWDKGGSLLERGDAISKLRTQLGYAEGFDLYERFVAYRRRRSSNDPGEPRLAQAFLAEIGEHEDGNDPSR